MIAPEIEFYLVKPNLNPNEPIEPPLGRTGRQMVSRQAYSMSAVDEYGNIYVADTGNNRVLMWESLPTSNGASADSVLCQEDFLGNQPNLGTGVASASSCVVSWVVISRRKSFCPIVPAGCVAAACVDAPAVRVVALVISAATFATFAAAAGSGSRSAEVNGRGPLNLSCARPALPAGVRRRAAAPAG